MLRGGGGGGRFPSLSMLLLLFPDDLGRGQHEVFIGERYEGGLEFRGDLLGHPFQQ